MVTPRILFLVALVGSTSSCSNFANQPEGLAELNREVLSREYCDEAVELLDKFDSILIENYLGAENLSGDLIYSAKEISGLVRRAEFEGVDLRAQEAVWFKNLQTGARAYVALAEANEDEFSVGELEGYLSRIDALFLDARNQCSGRDS